MVIKAITVMALFTTTARPGQSKNQIVDDLNEFSLQELLEFREKILEQKQNLEDQLDSDAEDESSAVESDFTDEKEKNNEIRDLDSYMQILDIDGLYEKIEEAVEERNQNEGTSLVMILAAEDDALKREIENNMHRSNSENLLALNQQLDTNVMYDPATRTGIVCVNGRCITNTPGGANTVVSEE